MVTLSTSDCNNQCSKAVAAGYREQPGDNARKKNLKKKKKKKIKIFFQDFLRLNI